jgi:hypothetical protein
LTGRGEPIRYTPRAQGARSRQKTSTAFRRPASLRPGRGPRPCPSAGTWRWPGCGRIWLGRPPPRLEEARVADIGSGELWVEFDLLVQPDGFGHGLLGRGAIGRGPVLRQCLREGTIGHRLGKAIGGLLSLEQRVPAQCRRGAVAQRHGARCEPSLPQSEIKYSSDLLGKAQALLHQRPSRGRVPRLAVGPAFLEVHDVDAELVPRRFGDSAGGAEILRPRALLIMDKAPTIESGSLGEGVRQFPGQRDRTVAIRPRLRRLAVPSKAIGGDARRGRFFAAVADPLHLFGAPRQQLAPPGDIPPACRRWFTTAFSLSASTSNTARFFGLGPRGLLDWPFLKRLCTGGLPRPTS